MKLRKYFGTREFLASALKLAIPIMLQNLLTTSFSLVDTLMIGWLGEEALAAVGFGAAWNNLVNVFFFGLASGAGIFFAQFWGARDRAGIHRALGLSISGTLIIALLATLVTGLAPRFLMTLFTDDPAAAALGADYLRVVAFTYPALGASLLVGTLLRCTEQVKLPLLGAAAGVAVNVFFNYVLIFGHFGAPALGITGAAIASLISAWVNLAVILIGCRLGRNIVVAPLSALFSFDRSFARYYVKVCSPALANEILWGLGVTVLSMIYGHIGTTEFAALTAFRTIDNFVTVLFISISGAATTLVGKRVGAGEYDLAYEEARTLSVWTPFVSLFFSAVVILLRAPIISIFQLDPEPHALAMSLMLLAAAELPIRYIPFVQIVGIFRAAGDAKIGMLLDLLGVWIISVPVAAICGLVLHWPFLLVYGLVVFADGGVKSIFCIRRFRSRKWIRPVTRQ